MTHKAIAGIQGLSVSRGLQRGEGATLTVAADGTLIPTHQQHAILPNSGVSDTVTDITTSNMNSGETVVFYLFNSAHDITFIDNAAGNFRTLDDNDIVLDTTSDRYAEFYCPASNTLLARRTPDSGIGGGGGGDTHPIADTTAIVKDPVDGSKRVRIDVGAVATLTTRSIIMPDQDISLSPDADFNAALATIGQAEAEAGTATTNRIWTAERVAQAIAALETTPANKIFYAQWEQANTSGKFRGKSIGASGNARLSFSIPDDYGSLVSLVNIGIPNSDFTSKNINHESENAGIGEDAQTHTDSDVAHVVSGTNNEFLADDISGVFGSLAPADEATVLVTHVALGASILYTRIKMVYTPA